MLQGGLSGRRRRGCPARSVSTLMITSTWISSSPLPTSALLPLALRVLLNPLFSLAWIKLTTLYFLAGVDETAARVALKSVAVPDFKPQTEDKQDTEPVQRRLVWCVHQRAA
jgi:hypothetical protein